MFNLSEAHICRDGIENAYLAVYTGNQKYQIDGQFVVLATITPAAAQQVWGAHDEMGCTVVSHGGEVFTVGDQNLPRTANLFLHSKCACCDRQTAYYRIEYSRGYNGATPVLNGYSDDHVLMTADHIVPRSKGGPDILENIQLMCVICNNRKKDRDMTEFQISGGNSERHYWEKGQNKEFFAAERERRRAERSFAICYDDDGCVFKWGDRDHVEKHARMLSLVDRNIKVIYGPFEGEEIKQITQCSGYILRSPCLTDDRFTILTFD